MDRYDVVFVLGFLGALAWGAILVEFRVVIPLLFP